VIETQYAVTVDLPTADVVRGDVVELSVGDYDEGSVAGDPLASA